MGPKPILTKFGASLGGREREGEMNFGHLGDPKNRNFWGKKKRSINLTNFY
jgi:hypothetical protein